MHVNGNLYFSDGLLLYGKRGVWLDESCFFED
jgi:hypothetical protein